MLYYEGVSRVNIEIVITGHYATRTKSVNIGAYHALREPLPLILLPSFPMF